MRYTALAASGALLLLTTLALAQGAKSVHVELKDPKGRQVGTATLTQGSKGVVIMLEISKLPPGTHAFHIHEHGHCDGPDFKSCGGHFNPFGKQHGTKNPKGPHAGDLPNIVVGSDGTLKQKIVASLVTLESGKNALLREGGTALVIHAAADDYKTDPAGNAGARIACGLIGKGE